MDRDLRFYFICIGIPAVSLTAAGLLALVFGVSGLKAGIRRPGYEKQLERYEQNVKSRMVRRARAFGRDRNADYVWQAGRAPWDTNAASRIKYGCYGATNETAIGWARLDDGRVIGYRMPPFKYRDRRDMYFMAAGAVMVVLLFFALFAGGWLLARAAKRAREDLDARNTFLDVISHELNTPLGSIVPLSSALAAGGIRSERRRMEALVTISRESARMARMIEELLTVVRLRNGKVAYAHERFALGETLENAAALVRARYQDCAIQTECDGGVFAFADRDKTEQVAINLIENACRYAGEDAIEVSCGAAGEGRVQIVVKDRGAGVPAAERERLFDRFYQSRAGASAGQGLGLGLNIVAGFARGMGGDVKVAARSGGGSVFTVELPGVKAPRGGKGEQRNG